MLRCFCKVSISVVRCNIPTTPKSKLEHRDTHLRRKILLVFNLKRIAYWLGWYPQVPDEENNWNLESLTPFQFGKFYSSHGGSRWWNFRSIIDLPWWVDSAPALPNVSSQKLRIALTFQWLRKNQSIFSTKFEMVQNV